jgi:hypothetical protein
MLLGGVSNAHPANVVWVVASSGHMELAPLKDRLDLGE